MQVYISSLKNKAQLFYILQDTVDTKYSCITRQSTSRKCDAHCLHTNSLARRQTLRCPRMRHTWGGSSWTWLALCNIWMILTAMGYLIYMTYFPGWTSGTQQTPHKGASSLSFQQRGSSTASYVVYPQQSSSRPVLSLASTAPCAACQVSRYQSPLVTVWASTLTLSFARTSQLLPQHPQLSDSRSCCRGRIKN